MTNHAHGVRAEKEAIKYLTSLGYTIIDHNWKTPWCEIDIIAKKDTCVYLIEVKYRLSDDFGSGLDFITPKKLYQMNRAAEGWVQAHNWEEDYQLAAIELEGTDYQISNFITDL